MTFCLHVVVVEEFVKAIIYSQAKLFHKVEFIENQFTKFLGHKNTKRQCKNRQQLNKRYNLKLKGKVAYAEKQCNWCVRLIYRAVDEKVMPHIAISTDV